MNLFCFSLEGSMDSLYEPVKENQEPHEATCMTSQANTPVNVQAKYGPPERSHSLEFSDTEGALMKKRKSIQKSMSENEAFDRKNVNGTIGQLPKKQENDLYFGRHCQSEEMKEEFLIGERFHLLQGTRIEETTCQVMTFEQWISPQNHDTSSDMVADTDENKAETMGTLKRLQKLVRTKKASLHNLDDIKHVLTPLNPPPQHACLTEDEDDGLTSCMKLTKSQEKKVLKENTKRKEERDTRTDFISTSLGRSYISRMSNLGNISIHSESEFQLWNDWKPFPDNQPCPCDFLIARIEEWEKCTCCSHQPSLSCSLTDVDLPLSWGYQNMHQQNNLMQEASNSSLREGQLLQSEISGFGQITTLLEPVSSYRLSNYSFATVL